jgi:predicted TIM-barrel fold metal-dependent hydrolase
MIIDAYNNIWQADGNSDYLTSEAFTPETFIASLDEAHVDMAVGCSLGQMIDNEYIFEVQQRFASRIIGFGQINPRQPDAVLVIRKMAGRWGFKGLKLHPQLHGYHFADHQLLDPIFRECDAQGMTILVNALDDSFCHPFAIEEIARKFPSVNVIIAHMGTVWNVNEAIIVASRNTNVYLETSSAQLLDVQMAYRSLGAGKIVMGTDWPGSVALLEREKIRMAVPDDGDRALVEGNNLIKILGL